MSNGHRKTLRNMNRMLGIYHIPSVHQRWGVTRPSILTIPCCDKHKKCTPSTRGNRFVSFRILHGFSHIVSYRAILFRWESRAIRIRFRPSFSGRNDICFSFKSIPNTTTDKYLDKDYYKPNRRKPLRGSGHSFRRNDYTERDEYVVR